MVAATKKGRPKSTTRVIADKSHEMASGVCIRADINKCYAIMCVQLNETEFKSFFVNEYGNFKRQGIAEQIGRIKEKGIATDNDLIELTRSCIEDYNNGQSVKEIEKRLRRLSMQLK